jgi:UDP-N-acetylmuramoyl-tripeptide--D-alanyl-D-alanine ligase
MLCFIKAAQYIDGYHSLIPVIEEAAPILAKSYSIDAWLGGKEDSDMTKGFYQWSSMFLTEYFHAGWTDYNLFGDFVIMLGHWIIYTHNILKRTKNTGYAFEGIISAYEIAKVRNDQVAMNTFAAVIDEGLYKLTTWQVGGPFADKNEFLKKHPSLARHAVGGVMGAWNDPKLRIDTTQHQMHAIMMAINTVYRR